MLKIIAIYKRELKYYFQHTAAYVTYGVFLFISGFFFFNQCAKYNWVSYQAARQPAYEQYLNLVEGIIQPLLSNISIVLLLVLPLLTMRLIAEEKREGTFELLLTYPVRDGYVIAGKFLASLTMFAIMIGATLLYPILLDILAEPEWGPILVGYLGLFLVGCTFISIGIFFSSVTSSQLVAGVLTFGLALFFLLIGWAAPFVGPRSSKIISQFSLLQHFGSFSKGVIDTQDVSYYIFLTTFFLFLSVRSLESTRWRS